MTTTTVPGRPSVLHEARVTTLAALATLAGYVSQVDVLPDGGRPDVLHARPRDHSLFIGDAKATETPGNTETAQRLLGYTTFLARYLEAGGSGVVALAVPVRERYGWLRLLRQVCAPLGADRAAGHVDTVDPDCAVVWQVYRGDQERHGRRSPMPQEGGRLAQGSLGVTW